ncbi:MAG TPA: GNAT family N-acetyltransferase [Ktedonobacterales bacterium]
MLTIIQAVTPEQVDAVRELMREHIAFIVDSGAYLDDFPTFQELDTELAHLATHYAPPDGRLMLAMVDATPAGCVALKRMDATTGELKRMFVRPGYRGQGIAAALVEALLAEARAVGYRRVALDTHVTMLAAQRLYRALGFADAPPTPGFPPALRAQVVFMARDLD